MGAGTLPSWSRRRSGATIRLQPLRRARPNVGSPVLARVASRNWIRALASQQGAWANIRPKRKRKESICFSPYLYRACNLVERFFNKIKQCRRIATRHDAKLKSPLVFIVVDIGNLNLSCAYVS